MNSTCQSLARTAIATCLLAIGWASPGDGADTSDVQGWTEYQYRYQVNDRLRTNWALGYRELLSSEADLEWSRLHLRSFLTYSASPLVSLEAGVGGFYSFRDPLQDQKELRTWLGANLRWPEVRPPHRHFPFQHRLRLEQRWIDRGSELGSDFGWRLRYRIAVGIPLNNFVVEEKTYYLPIATEYFWDLGDDTPEFFAARLRATIGLGYVIGPNWALEFRYTGQSSRDTVIQEFETTDHIFDFRIRTTLRIRDLSLPW